MSIYEEKTQARIKRYKKNEEKSKERSNNLYLKAKKMASVIPFGQPIMIGHHSEKKDRSYREKIESSFKKSFEEAKKSEYWKNKVTSTESNTNIYSDDPEAIKKIKNKIEVLIKHDENSKLLNTKLRKFKTYTNALEKLKLLDDEESKMLYQHISQSANLYAQPPEFISCYYYGYNSPEIRRLKKRLAYLEKDKKREPICFEVKNIKVIEEEGQIRVHFPYKPDSEIRKKLKSYPY